MKPALARCYLCRKKCVKADEKGHFRVLVYGKAETPPVCDPCCERVDAGYARITREEKLALQDRLKERKVPMALRVRIVTVAAWKGRIAV